MQWPHFIQQECSHWFSLIEPTFWHKKKKNYLRCHTHTMPLFWHACMFVEVPSIVFESHQPSTQILNFTINWAKLGFQMYSLFIGWRSIEIEKLLPFGVSMATNERRLIICTNKKKPMTLKFLHAPYKWHIHHLLLLKWEHHVKRKRKKVL